MSALEPFPQKIARTEEKTSGTGSDGEESEVRLMCHFDEGDFLEFRAGAMKELKMKLKKLALLYELCEKELGVDNMRGLREKVDVKLGLQHVPAVSKGNPGASKISSVGIQDIEDLLMPLKPRSMKQLKKVNLKLSTPAVTGEASIPMVVQMPNSSKAANGQSKEGEISTFQGTAAGLERDECNANLEVGDERTIPNNNVNRKSSCKTNQRQKAGDGVGESKATRKRKRTTPLDLTLSKIAKTANEKSKEGEISAIQNKPAGLGRDSRTYCQPWVWGNILNKNANVKSLRKINQPQTPVDGSKVPKVTTKRKGNTTDHEVSLTSKTPEKNLCRQSRSKSPEDHSGGRRSESKSPEQEAPRSYPLRVRNTRNPRIYTDPVQSSSCNRNAASLLSTLTTSSGLTPAIPGPSTRGSGLRLILTATVDLEDNEEYLKNRSSEQRKSDNKIGLITTTNAAPKHRRVFAKRAKPKPGKMGRPKNKPSKCPFKGCDKKFKRMGDLEQHAVVHSQHRDFKCDICKQMFKRKGDRDAHVRRLHPDDKDEHPRYICRMCKANYGRVADFNRHRTKKGCPKQRIRVRYPKTKTWHYLPLEQTGSEVSSDDAKEYTRVYKQPEKPQPEKEPEENKKKMRQRPTTKFFLHKESDTGDEHSGLENNEDDAAEKSSPKGPPPLPKSKFGATKKSPPPPPQLNLRGKQKVSGETEEEEEEEKKGLHLVEEQL